MLTLKTLRSPKGANRDTKRIGRGQGSGRGTQAGKGGKGQTARKSGPVKTGFEGGQMPLYRRLPKRGFLNQPFKKVYVEVNLCDLEKIKGGLVSRETLIESGLIKGKSRSGLIKILGDGELKRPLEFIGIDKFTEQAVKKINHSGGKISVAKKEA